MILTYCSTSHYHTLVKVTLLTIYSVSKLFSTGEPLVRSTLTKEPISLADAVTTTVVYFDQLSGACSTRKTKMGILVLFFVFFANFYSFWNYIVRIFSVLNSLISLSWSKYTTNNPCLFYWPFLCWSS